MSVPTTTFTRDDQAQAQDYLSHRALLYQLWDLATTYPNIASKIHIRIRKADPATDYRYDDATFGDAAIVVGLSWFDNRSICDFMNCLNHYPPEHTCTPYDEPRVYPSGDHTTVTACQPACFMTMHSRNKYGQMLEASQVALQYKSTSAVVMSAHSGLYHRVDANGTAAAAATATAATAAAAAAADLAPLEYMAKTNSCEFANLAILQYVTQPLTRANDKNKVCRLTNFMIGDDLSRIASSSSIPELTTGQHSSTYCDGFDQNFDKSKKTCEESTFDTIMSYIFVGTALVRLARHALAGGDRCDQILPTNAARPEVDVVRDVPLAIRSRAHWLQNVDRQWCLPPPNVMLSDLGITDLGQVWSNAGGGRLEPARHDDYPHRRHSRRVHGTQELDSAAATDDTPFAGYVAKTDKLLDFDQLYEDAVGTRGSDKNAKIWESLGITAANVVAYESARALVRRVLRSAYNRTLRFIARDFTGATSRTLIGLGVRTAAASTVSHVLARFSTRIMTALCTTASGVGTVLGMVEIVAVILDFMLLVGWDPGNYRSQFDNAVFDDLALQGYQLRKFQEMTTFTPYVVLTIFERDREGAVVADGGGGGDTSMEPPAAAVDTRFRIERASQVPWYFDKFKEATETIIADSSPTGGDDSDGGDGDERHTLLRSRKRMDLSRRPRTDPLKRQRPIITDNMITTNLLTSMHYFNHRTTNSLGQVVNTSDDNITISDDVLSTAVRDNELASFLSSAYSTKRVPRSTLLGAARRNVVAKTTTALLCVVLASGVVWTLGFVSLIRRRQRKRYEQPNLDIAITIAIVMLIFVVPVSLFIVSLESILGDKHDRSFDRNTDDDTDAIDRFCDTITNALRNIAQREQLGPIVDLFRQELRVIYNQ